MGFFGRRHHNCDNPMEGAPPWDIEIYAMLGFLVQRVLKMESEMALDFTKLIAATTRQQGVKNSVLQFIADQGAELTRIRQQLADAIAANDPAAMAAAQAQLDAFAEGIDQNDDAIAAAVVAPGTPGTPPPA